MNMHNLGHLFEPRSIAVIGASNRHVGSVIMRNLLTGGFAGPVMPVNPRHRAVAGVLAYPDVASLPMTPDLAIICTPPQVVPESIDQLGQRGTRAAVVVTGGLSQHVDTDGRNLSEVTFATAARHGLRILGGNTLGLLVPGLAMNASFSHVSALPGNVAFVSQSGALCTAVLDWAHSRSIGFSHFISLGDAGDIGFGDVLDFLGDDPDTHAILLYIESIATRGNFVAAARAAARNKPIVAVKADRGSQQPVTLAEHMTHASILATRDKVFDAVLHRAGILRVQHIEELFAAVETLSHVRRVRGNRLAVVANGGGAGIMAVDALRAGGLEPAELSDETLTALDAVLPDNWSRTNPVDVIVNAPGSRYAEVLEILLGADEVDVVLVIHAPTAVADGDDIARQIINAVRKRGRSRLLTAWIGAETVSRARDLFARANVPSYDSPEQAVTAFLHLVTHARDQAMLTQTPPTLATEFRPHTQTARQLVNEALAAGMMTEPQSLALLEAYGLQTVPMTIAADADEAAALAPETGFPLAMTVHSPDIARKRDVGGIAIYLESAEAVRSAGERMLARVREQQPDARIRGLTLQRMTPRPNARQLIIGVATDALFGPVIVFGEGGRALELPHEYVVGLPPLNMPLARDMISHTRIWQLLQTTRARPAADIDAICLALVRISQLIVDVPEIVAIDINPLFADTDGVTAVNAHVSLSTDHRRSFSIRPYPQSLEEHWQLQDGQSVLVRPIRPEDEHQHQAMLEHMDAEDLRLRFFQHVRRLTHARLVRFTQIDYDREMAFVAVSRTMDTTLGVVRLVAAPDGETAEFAVLVRSDLKGRGLGSRLLEKMIRYAREQGVHMLEGVVLSDNQGMLGLAQRLGMTIGPGPEAGTVSVLLNLRPDDSSDASR